MTMLCSSPRTRRRTTTVLCLTLTITLPLVSKAQNQTPATFVLQEMKRALQEVESVHLRAKATISRITNEGFVEGSGEFEYWAEDVRYRINCSVAGELGLIEDMEFAYDGERFFAFLENSSMLSIRSTDPGAPLPTAIPNPFFLPLRHVFASPYLARFSKLHQSETWDVAHEVYDDEDREVILFEPKGALHGESSVHVRIDHGYSVPLVETIEVHDAAGQVLERIELNEFQQVSGVDYAFPRSLRLTGYMPSVSEDPLSRVEYRVETVEVNVPIDPAIFQIELDRARTVLDEDSGQYLKQEVLEEHGH